MIILDRICIIYRDKKSNELKKYSFLRQSKEVVENKIKEYNEINADFNAEITENQDIISLIEMAEENRKTKAHQVRSIEESIELLRNEVYDLQNNVKDN